MKLDRSPAIRFSQRIWLFSVTACFLLLLANASPAETPGAGASFDEANKLYAQARFAEAAAAYEDFLKSGKASAAVYFNLGNAYFKAGKIGLALAAYRRAEAETPRDPDVQANLRFARNRVQGLTLGISGWQRVLGKLSLDEWAIAASAGFWAFCLLLFAGQLRPRLKPALKVYLAGSIAVTLLLCACLVMALNQSRSPVAIVTASEAPVRQAPLVESGNVFTARDGAELQVVDRKGEWLQVSAGPNRIGWIDRSRVSVVNGS